MKAALLSHGYWALRVCSKGRVAPTLISFNLLTSQAVAYRDELKL